MKISTRSHEQVAGGDRGLVARIGPVQIDVPRSLGYYGGVALAVSAGIVDPPVGVFIASVPVVKMLARPGMFAPLRAVGLFLDGMAKPVGGEGDGYVRLADAPRGAAHLGGGRHADRGHRFLGGRRIG